MKMKTKLIVAAIGGAFAAPGLALAQSSVQVYGTVHMSVNQTKYGDGTVATVKGTTKYGVNSHASNWGLRSTENLGGGMTAWFQAEFNSQMERRADLLSVTTNTPRNSGVGLRSSAWGNIYLGTWETPWAQTFRLWDVGSIGGWGPVTSIIGRRENTGIGPSRNCSQVVYFNCSAAPSTALGALAGFNGAAAANVGYALWRRFGSSIFYESPIWSGVQFKLAIMPNETKATNNNATDTPAGTTIKENPSAWSGSVTWTGMGGRARAFLANMRAKDWSSIGNTDSGYTIGGGYDFGPANLGATYEKYTYRTGGAGQLGAGVGDVDAKEWAVALKVPIGPGHIGASYAKATNLSGGGALLAGTDTSAKMWNIGYEWALSKRTNLGFGVAKIDNGRDQSFTWTGQTNGTGGASDLINGAGQSQTNIFVSIRHSF